ncbi:MAG: lactate racemase domain-containing protein [Pirellulaceae bacterium]
MTNYPQLFRLRQQFEGPVVDDVAGEVEQQLASLALAEKIQPGQSVAITAGSRGIANIEIIIRGICQHLKALGAEPFIVPAMGSHGGGTAAGQQQIIESYGITEEFCGCPIRASMDTVVVCRAEEGFPVHFDQQASEADHVFVCGRVKPHTGFHGDIESGLMKMMLIGLGKHAGALIYHRAIMNYSFGQIVRSVAREVLAKCRIVGGLAIVENAYDETAKLAGVAPEKFEEEEKGLLVLAKQWMPRLPFDQVDILTIDEIGKNISGSGLDTNVVGRKYLDHRAAEEEYPKVKKIIVRGLTAETHGNAAGIGLAEFCLSRVVEQMNVQATRVNCLTGGHPTGAMIPLDYETDRETLDMALSTIGLIKPRESRLMWIRDTLDVAEVECSAAYMEEAQQRADLEVLTPLRDMPFDADGNLPDVQALAQT